MIEIILLIVSGFVMLYVMLFAKPDYNNQVSTFVAILFWGSTIIFSTSFVLMAMPHSSEFIGWQNTVKACDYYTNNTGCSSSGFAGYAIDKYRIEFNLNTTTFPTYIIASDETPPLW